MNKETQNMGKYDSTYSALVELNQLLGGSEVKQYDSEYSVWNDIYITTGGDASKGFDSIVDIVEGIKDVTGGEIVPSGGMGLDFSVIGYDDKLSKKLNSEIFKEWEGVDEYTTELYNKWDSSNTSMDSRYSNNKNIVICPFIDTSNVTRMYSTFKGCSSLIYIPPINTSNVTNMYSAFYGCSSLREFPQIDTGNVMTMQDMFCDCTSLTSIPLLDTSNLTNSGGFFGWGNQLVKLTDLGGFKNLKVGITKYFLDKCPYLTVDSLMNVINNLYDLTANGLSGQTLSFGTTNLGKLTAEQIAVATNKGWTLT